MGKVEKMKNETKNEKRKNLKNRKNMKKRKKNGRLKSQLFFSCRLPKNSAYRGEGEGKRRVADGTIGNFKENVVKPVMFDQESMNGCSPFVRGVSWSEVATVPKRKSHRGLDLDLSLNSEVNIWKGWKKSGGTK